MNKWRAALFLMVLAFAAQAEEPQAKNETAVQDEQVSEDAENTNEAASDEESDAGDREEKDPFDFEADMEDVWEDMWEDSL